MTYRGKYRLKNVKKYRGDPDNVIYRSSWERAVFKHLDLSSDIVWFAAEEVAIPYVSPIDGRRHRYFPDIMFETTSGDKWMIEIKPERETLPPKTPKRRTRRYLEEAMTYAKNMSKWEAAKAACERSGYKFAIWTEKTLTAMGIKILYK